MTRANCWAHGRRQFFELVDVARQLKRKRDARPIASPLALEALQRIDRIFEIEREINGKTAAERLAVRRERAAPIVSELEGWMREQRNILSRHDPVANAINTMLNTLQRFTHFLRHWRICLSNKTAQRQ